MTADVEVKAAYSGDSHLTKKRRFALELFEHGFGYTRAAAILELSENTVHDWAKLWKKGRFEPRMPDYSQRYSEETRAKAVKLRAQGLSWRKISAATGASMAACRKWCGPKPVSKEEQDDL